MRRLALSALIVVACAAPAAAASWFEQNFYLSGPRYDAVVPLCHDPAVLGQISSKFSEKESVHWNSSLQIVGVDRIREIAWRPWAAQTIPRRFCTGIAHVSDGTRQVGPVSLRVLPGQLAANGQRTPSGPLRLRQPVPFAVQKGQGSERQRHGSPVVVPIFLGLPAVDL